MEACGLWKHSQLGHIQKEQFKKQFKTIIKLQYFQLRLRVYVVEWLERLSVEELDSSRVDIQIIHNSSILVFVKFIHCCRTHMYTAGGP